MPIPETAARPDVQIGDIVDVPKGADVVCTVRHRVEVTQINDFAVSGPRIKADGTRMRSQSSITADENGFYTGVVTWDVLAKSTVYRQGSAVIRPKPTCERCGCDLGSRDYDCPDPCPCHPKPHNPLCFDKTGHEHDIECECWCHGETATAPYSSEVRDA